MIKNPPDNAGDAGSILNPEDPLKEEMATHSSVLAWRIPWTKEPGRLQSMESQRVRQDWATILTQRTQLGFLGGSAVENLPAAQETHEMLVRSLGWDDPLEEGMATHSSTLAWRIPWTEEPGGLQSTWSQRDTIEWLNTHAHARVSLSHTRRTHLLSQPRALSTREDASPWNTEWARGTLLRRSGELWVSFAQACDKSPRDAQTVT